ncbi:MAG: hypothetical protein Q4C47_07360, partial [Planctomycetia bacterium]|nr:hypothetical protein [Planctomycetia bacterium]
ASPSPAPPHPAECAQTGRRTERTIRWSAPNCFVNRSVHVKAHGKSDRSGPPLSGTPEQMADRQKP